MIRPKISPAQLPAAVCLIVSTICVVAGAHDITTRVTWNREISRIVFARCASCHLPGGSAFSLLSYREASPWASAIKDDVLQRKMPPWGAVKGFGTFRNDQGLSQEEIDLIGNWVDGGVPEGNPDHLQTRVSLSSLPAIAHRPGEVVASGGDFRLQRPFTLDGFLVMRHPRSASAPITIEFPDGRIEPLVWLNDDSAQEHPFLLRTPLSLPPGAVVRGLSPGLRLVLLPVTSDR